MCYSQSYCHKPYQVYRLLPEEIINHTFWWSPVLLRLLLCNGTSCSSKKTTGQHWFWQSKCAISPQGCYWVMIYKWWAFHICFFTSGYLSVSHLDIGSFSSFPRFFSIQIMPTPATVGNLEHLSPMGQHVPKNIHRYMAWYMLIHLGQDLPWYNQKNHLSAFPATGSTHIAGPVPVLGLSPNLWMALWGWCWYGTNVVKLENASINHTTSNFINKFIRIWFFQENMY